MSSVNAKSNTFVVCKGALSERWGRIQTQSGPGEPCGTLGGPGDAKGALDAKRTQGPLRSHGDVCVKLGGYQVALRDAWRALGIWGAPGGC